jgi:hypothetical protein
VAADAAIFVGVRQVWALVTPSFGRRQLVRSVPFNSLDSSCPAAQVLAGEGGGGSGRLAEPASPISAAFKASGLGTAIILGESSPAGPSECRLAGRSDWQSPPPSPPEGDSSAASPVVGASPAKSPAPELRPTGDSGAERRGPG